MQPDQLDPVSLTWTIDPVGEALYFLRMNGMYYSSCQFTSPWGLVLPPIPGSLMVHVVTSGQCWLEVGAADARLLRPGDLALVPHGEGHRLTSTPGHPGIGLFDVPREQVSERFEILRQGGAGALTTLVCGTASFDHPAAHHLISLLPGSATGPRRPSAVRSSASSVYPRAQPVAIRRQRDRASPGQSGWSGRSGMKQRLTVIGNTIRRRQLAGVVHGFLPQSLCPRLID